MQLREKTSNIGNIDFKELVQGGHVSFFAEEDIVCEILNDLRNDHQSSLDGTCLVAFRDFDVDSLRGDNGRGNES